MEEKWRDIPGYEGLYQVSNFGRVRNHKGVILALNKRPSNTQERYLIKLSKNNKKRSFLVHRLVATAFIPNPEDKETVNHIDGDPLNNRSDNLEWATKSENHLHRVYSLGEHSLLPCKPVRCVESGQIYPSLCAAARDLRIQQSSISQVINGHRGVKTAGGYHWELANQEGLM